MAIGEPGSFEPAELLRRAPTHRQSGAEAGFDLGQPLQLVEEPGIDPGGDAQPLDRPAPAERLHDLEDPLGGRHLDPLGEGLVGEGRRRRRERPVDAGLEPT